MRIFETHYIRVVVLGVSVALESCDRDFQAVRITAQDFRFTPATIHLTAASPIYLTIVNEGREPHEFESSILAHRVDGSGGNATSVRVASNQRTDMMIRTIPGTYIFYCRIRGHANMSGTIIVE
ncbi:MAG TPA: cupredoxin domain-containing protein [Nitrospiraceae bacterium]